MKDHDQQLWEEERLLGYKIRKPYDSEILFFKKNPQVSGMASKDGAIVLSPLSGSDVNSRSVAENEAFRLYLRDNQISPNFDVSPEQRRSFKGTPYEKNDSDLKATIAARIYSGDPSSLATRQQQQWLESFLLDLEIMKALGH